MEGLGPRGERVPTVNRALVRVFGLAPQVLSHHLALKAIDAQYANGGACRASTTRLQLALLKVALLLGVQVTIRPELSKQRAQGGFDLSHAAAYDVLLIATGHNPMPLKPLDVFRQQATVSPYTPHPSFDTASQRNATATALVAHFELTDRTAAAARWLK
eukprot:2542426-Prymnesium_polylepis.1